MLNYTFIARKSLQPQAERAIEAAHNCERTQRKILEYLLGQAALTKWGRHRGISARLSYEEYSSKVRVHDYEYFRSKVMRMINGEKDVLWPGITKRFAQSSGTSGGKSKYIPVTDDSLKQNHYPGAAVSVGLYLRAYRHSRMFAGKGLILGGSFANELSLPPEVKVGDLSANLIDAVNPLVNLVRIPSKRIALMEDWSEKLPAIVEASMHKDVTNLSGVPSWMLRVLQQVLERTGESCVQDVWPNLEVFFHGGIAFEPYRGEYDKIMDHEMRYWETYNASEGFFAAQIAPNDSGMLLIPNIGVFYEFVPLDQAGLEHPKSLPMWEVKRGETYSLVITSSNGMWRYALGDTVKIVGLDPVRIVIAGRTTSFINAFGEEVMEYNTNAAMARTCEEMGCEMRNYTVAPVYTLDGKRGRHQWLIEWEKAPEDIEGFAEALDKALQQENSDYQAKRSGGIFLDRLEVTTAEPGTFDRWLAATGKLGGQRKVPRLSNDRNLIDSILKN
ncbi:MAG: GH3 auxin-responsive promoter family protein [Bacteroidales bacterium]|nr:GH3 auxin-responsive promoter family protein [Bacteroidales bacterium]